MAALYANSYLELNNQEEVVGHDNLKEMSTHGVNFDLGLYILLTFNGQGVGVENQNRAKPSNESGPFDGPISMELVPCAYAAKF